MHQAPSGGLAAKGLRDPQRLGEDRAVFEARVVALDGHGAGEVGADYHAKGFFFDTSAGELRGRPIKPRLDLGPSALEPSEPAEDGDVVAMSIEPLQRFSVALDKLAVRSNRFRPRSFKRLALANGSTNADWCC
jgi:hypothetical protein